MMIYCEKCKKHKFVSRCGCVGFSVVNEDGDEYEIYACSPQEAAENYAKQSNEENDYYLMESSVVVEVNGIQYEISAEASVNYFAAEI